ncbi:hypothetical protein KO481_16485 [Nocardia sp. NEAU-G5]|uniref:TrbL/VirB6 plasmid conjugal transfer protein n=1 Tax=Nocardia albiluteola TaxID=2842303 RepID=A0ABS6B1L4_9NOCA|nr:hypothetical protein [Nocardia albiluteola]MBU3063119.1 hypothetical protein [Nocardia albiluteola]
MAILIALVAGQAHAQTSVPPAIPLPASPSAPSPVPAVPTISPSAAPPIMPFGPTVFPGTESPTTTPSPAPSSNPSSNDPTWKVNQGCPDGISVLGLCTSLKTPNQYIKDGAGDAVNSTLASIVNWVLAGYVWLQKYAWQLFINVNIDDSGTAQVTAVQKMNDMTSELQVVACGLGLLIAIMQILAQRMLLSGDNAAPEAFSGFLRWALAATLAAPTLLALSGASEALAQWMFMSAAGPAGPTHVVDALSTALSGKDARLKTADVISVALCLLGMIAFLELAIQLFLQKAWLVYIAVALPIAGAASVTGAGRAVFSAMLRLGVTVVLFKPVAALLFSVGFFQIQALDSGGFASGDDVVMAVLMMAAPSFALPVLTNLIGNTSVGFAGTPMLRSISQVARSGRSMVQNAGRRTSGWAGDWDARARGNGSSSGDRNSSRSDARASTAAPPATGGANAANGATGKTSGTGTGTASNRAGNTATTISTGGPGASARSGGTGTGSRTSGSTGSGRGRTTAAPGGRGRSGQAAAPPTTSSGTRSGAAGANRAGGRSGQTAATPNSAPPPAPPQRSAPRRRSGAPRDTSFRRIT